MSYVRRVVSPPRVYSVNSMDTAHRNTPFTSPFYIQGFPFMSVSQIFYAVCLAQHCLFGEVHHLWESYPNCVNVPSHIRGVVDNYFQQHNMEFSAQWLVHSKDVMQRIILTLLEDQNSDMSRFFRSIHAEYGTDVQFVETTFSNKERVFSCGHPPHMMPSHPSEYAGANLFGETLTELFLYFAEGLNGDYYEALPSMKSLLSTIVYPRRSYTKTAVIISDSTFRHVHNVEGGDIWIQSGKTFRELAYLITSRFGNFASFKYVIIAAGTNDAKLLQSKEDFESSWQYMAQFLFFLRDHPEMVVVFNSVIGISALPWLQAYGQWFREAFQRDFGMARNFLLMDWSTPHQGNFFIDVHGNAKPSFFDRRHGFNGLVHMDHPNSRATRRMYKEIGRALADKHLGDLRAIRMTTSNKLYPVPQITEREHLF